MPKEMFSLTKLYNAVVNNQIRCIRLVVHVRRLVEQTKQLLSVNKRLVNRAINITELIQRRVELKHIGLGPKGNVWGGTAHLREISDEDDKFVRLGNVVCNPQGNYYGPNEKAEGLRKERKFVTHTSMTTTLTIIKF